MLVSVSILLLLCLLVIFGSRLNSFAEHHLYRDQVVFDRQTPYQKIILTQQSGSGDYRMYIDGHIQFSARDEHRYHEALVHPLMSLPGPKQHILILGGGDGLAARELLKYPEIESIDLVDIDPEITRIASSFPALVELNGNSLKNDKLTVINADAFSYINQAGKHYDRVIIDMPDPHNEALNKLYSREFYKMIKRRLTDNGVIVSQSSSPFYARRTYWSIGETLKSAGFNTYSYQITIPSFGIWGFHLARQQAINADEFSIQVPTQYLTEASLAAATVFAKDIAPIPVPINTMLEPRLYTLYIEDIQK